MFEHDLEKTRSRRSATSTRADRNPGPSLPQPDADDVERAAAICPTGSAAPPRRSALDLGRCLFCGECARIGAAQYPLHERLPHRLADARRTRRAARRQMRSGSTPRAVRPEIGRYFGRSLQLREVCAGGDASVEMELNATGNVNFDLGTLTASASPPRPAMLTAWWCPAPITVNMAEALRKSAAMPLPIPKSSSSAARKPVRAGCSPAAAPSTAPSSIRTPPDLWLPGAPTHPMTYIDGILNLLGQQKTRMTMQRLRTIFASFFKIGLFTFGGGYAMLPLIEQRADRQARDGSSTRNSWTC